MHNSKFFGVPQSRKRLYIVGYLGGRCVGEIFPLACGDGSDLKQLIPGPQGQRVYDVSGVACTQTAGAGGWGGNGLDGVMIASNVGTDRQLGQFVIDNELNEDVNAIPETSLYLLDLERIGRLQRDVDGGVFVGNCYVVAGAFEMPHVYDGIHLPGAEPPACEQQGIRHISEQELRAMAGQEGLVLQGCGGDLKEWVDGINGLLTESGILRNGTVFTEAYAFSHDGLTNLLFPFEDRVDIDVGRLAIWRLATHEQFGGTWLSDYIPNRLEELETDESQDSCQQCEM